MSWAKATRGVLLLAVVSWAPELAAAEPEGVRFHLVYDAPSSCPSSRAFLAAIRARTERPRLATSEEEATTFAVRFADEGRGEATGRLEIRDPDGSKQERVVTSRTCGEVAKALALVVALVLDPDADTSREPAREPEPAAPPPPPRRPPPPSPMPAPRMKVGIGAGAEVGLRGGVGPAIAPGGGIFVDAELGGGGWPAWLAPSARIALDVAATSSDLAVGSHAYFWVAGSVRLCPIHLAFGPGFRAAPCAGFEIGTHRGTTSDVPRAGAYSELWLAPTAVASLSWAASPTLSLELQPGIVAPLRRTRFFLAPDLTIFRVPAIAATIGAAVVVRFR